MLEILTSIHNTDWFYAVFIFVARVADVSLGTLRTIAIVHGRTLMAFWLGFFESAIWLLVVSGIVQSVHEQPLLGLVYALGFATGNIVGIKVEKLIAIGHLMMRAISRKNSKKIAQELRRQGYRVTSFTGEGKSGPVTELYIVCRRREIKKLLKVILGLDPDAFYVTEQAGAVSNVCRPIMQPVTGWRSVFKMK